MAHTRKRSLSQKDPIGRKRTPVLTIHPPPWYAPTMIETKILYRVRYERHDRPGELIRVLSTWNADLAAARFRDVAARKTVKRAIIEVQHLSPWVVNADSQSGRMDETDGRCSLTPTDPPPPSEDSTPAGPVSSPDAT